MGPCICGHVVEEHSSTSECEECECACFEEDYEPSEDDEE